MGGETFPNGNRMVGLMTARCLTVLTLWEIVVFLMSRLLDFSLLSSQNIVMWSYMSDFTQSLKSDATFDVWHALPGFADPRQST